jgi:hypothetical protein
MRVLHLIKKVRLVSSNPFSRALHSLQKYLYSMHAVRSPLSSRSDPNTYGGSVLFLQLGVKKEKGNDALRTG